MIMQLVRYVHSFKSFWNVQRDTRNQISAKAGMIMDKIVKFKGRPPKIENDLVVECERVTYSMKHYEAITEYLDSKTCRKGVKSKIPSHYMLRTFKTPNSLFLIDSDVASSVFKAIYPHLKGSKGPILEINAGVGMLTELLLKARLPRLRVYESDTTLYNQLHVLILKEKSDAELFRANLLQLWHMTKLDRDDNQNRVGRVFEGIPTFAWEDEPVMKMIVTIPTEKFISYIMYSIIFQSEPSVYGRPELFATMLPNVYRKFTARPEDGNCVYRHKSVMFQLLFEHKKLNTVPEKAYLPWMTRRKKKRPSIEDTDVMYLVKITSRQDLFQKVPPHLINALWYFVRQLLKRRKARLIASMEQWAPSCGPKLIAEGYTIYTECGTITPEKFLELFQTFASWPEFQTGTFLPSIDGVMLKMSDPGMFEQVMAEKVRRKEMSAADIKGEEDCLEEDDENLTDDEESDSDENEEEIDR